MNNSGDSEVSDDLEEDYRSQISEAIQKEAERRISEKNDPIETSRLLSLSLLELFETGDKSLVPALMARLGPVRAALEGHGGALVVSSGEIEVRNNGDRALSLVIDLDGACVSCGAAPGTLQGIQDDLLHDNEVCTIRFDSSMLDWFDDIQRDFVLNFGGVTFV
ncbi:MAG: NifU family protein [Candidatus Thalassarchaeaceae archaeon]|nr:NifU family protein [Candidatus Thalassarchaeaceae archaeon]|tara:strand:- start:2940 stop:3431 length:492 start_codon:yes stop_codon:yes gene_type:complete